VVERQNLHPRQKGNLALSTFKISNISRQGLTLYPFLQIIFTKSYVTNLIKNRTTHETLRSENHRFTKVMRHLETINKRSGLDRKYAIKGEEVIIGK
jgi:hypothetical protein